MRHPYAIAAVAFALAACTDAPLKARVEPDAPLPRLSIQGLACAPPDEVIEVPYRILFVIDVSHSNYWPLPDGVTIPPPGYDFGTDPPRDDNGNGKVANTGTTRRERAVKKVITDYLDSKYENVRFGVITFETSPTVQTYEFTRDFELLNAATINVGRAFGDTNYSDTITAAKEVILTDIEELGPARARLAHYLVFWVSDGLPTVGNVYPKALVGSVSAMKTNVAGRVAKLVFNTAFLKGTPLTGTEPEQIEKERVRRMKELEAEDLLRGMATAGGGEFINISQEEEIKFDVDTKPLSRRFTISKDVVAYNHNTGFGRERPLVDSDGDGLSDEEELGLLLDPTNADSDGDGFGDGVEAAMPALANPREGAAAPCGQSGDSDGDGLKDCEEALLNTDPLNPDSDGDGVIDTFEVLRGSSPLNAAAVDSDQDGLHDLVEVKSHLAPQEANPPEVSKNWSYQYRVDALPADQNPGQRCFYVQVGNVSLIQTEAHGGKPLGTNTIELIVSFAPEDGGGPVYFYRAAREARFLAPSSLDPPSASFNLQTTDFARLK